MATLPRRTRLVAGIALAATAALALASCAAEPAASGESADTDAAASDAATATSLADFGTLADLEEAAKAEGQLNVIALPRDWANYGEIIDLFKDRYPEITVNEQSPDVSSAEEITAAETNKGLDTAPDVFDLGLTVALQSTEHFAPYQVENWDDIPDALKEPTGLFVGDYGGYMSIGYDSSKFAERYPEITINEQSPDVSSAEEIQAAETNKGLDTAPDVFDLGLTVALQSTDQFAPYQVETWDEIPDAL